MNIKMWWSLKGEEKVKEIIGKISRTILYLLLGLGLTLLIGGLIIHQGWLTIPWVGVTVLFIFIVYAAATWTGKAE